jgi:hypothetical protein
MHLHKTVKQIEHFICVLNTHYGIITPNSLPTRGAPPIKIRLHLRFPLPPTFAIVILNTDAMLSGNKTIHLTLFSSSAAWPLAVRSSAHPERYKLSTNYCHKAESFSRRRQIFEKKFLLFMKPKYTFSRS